MTRGLISLVNDNNVNKKILVYVYYASIVNNRSKIADLALLSFYEQ